jgi:hypothetical protein
MKTDAKSNLDCAGIYELRQGEINLSEIGPEDFAPLASDGSEITDRSDRDEALHPASRGDASLPTNQQRRSLGRADSNGLRDRLGTRL